LRHHIFSHDFLSFDKARFLKRGADGRLLVKELNLTVLGQPSVDTAIEFAALQTQFGLKPSDRYDLLPAKPHYLQVACFC
jgi:hypothetical protein